MKRIALSLALVAFVLSCKDAAAPDPHSALRVVSSNPALVPGHIPPPPTDAVIDVSVSSNPLFGQFTGVYFANGANVEAATAAQLIGDESLAFLGTAWLRFDNKQMLGTSASANARFQRTDQKLSGMGTLVIDGHTVRIDEVTSFTANPNCTVFGEQCAIISFTATVDGESGHTGHADAFSKETCTLVTPLEGNPYYVCQDL